jgi:hypothetical protein
MLLVLRKNLGIEHVVTSVQVFPYLICMRGRESKYDRLLSYKHTHLAFPNVSFFLKLLYQVRNPGYLLLSLSMCIQTLRAFA